MQMPLSTPRIEMQPVAALKPYPGNARKHSKKQIRQIADSISRFGFTNPVLIGDGGEIVAGHGRVMAARTSCTDTSARQSARSFPGSVAPGGSSAFRGAGDLFCRHLPSGKHGPRFCSTSRDMIATAPDSGTWIG
jgi:hypothetical protein